MKLNLFSLSIATLTAALSFPATAALGAAAPTAVTDVSSSGTKDQPKKLAMKCGTKCGMKCDGKDCGNCGGICGGECVGK